VAAEGTKISRMYWLQTIGQEMVAARLGIMRKVAEVVIGTWLRDCRKDYEGLASIISAANDQGLKGDGFRNVVGQRIRDLKREQNPQLPLGITSIKGGAA
jgi:hypothetical protein